jgi:hypothetical protein
MKMASQTFVLSAGSEAQRFTTAFYKYVELRGWTCTDPQGRCTVITEPGGSVEAKVVSLWSDAALADFRAFWERYQAVSVFEQERRARLGDGGSRH